MNASQIAAMAAVPGITPQQQQQMLAYQNQQNAAAQSKRKAEQTGMSVPSGLAGPSNGSSSSSASKKFKPTLQTLPQLLQIPESKMFADLLSMEERLDWTITRKRNEMQDTVGKPVKVKRTLRIFISNTSVNPPPLPTAAPSGSDPAASSTDLPFQTTAELAAAALEKEKSAALDADTSMDDFLVDGGAGLVEDENDNLSKPAATDPSSSTMATAEAEGEAHGEAVKTEGGVEVSEEEKARQAFEKASKEAAETAEKDKAEKEADDKKAKETADAEKARQAQPASWTLRIEGRLIDSGNPRLDKATKRPFSTFIKSLSVDLDAPHSTTISHIRHPASPPVDGYEIMRSMIPSNPSDPNANGIKARIAIYLDHPVQKFKLLNELVAMIGQPDEDTRTGVIERVWTYVKSNSLVDREDRRRIKLDNNFRRMMPGHDTLPFHNLPELINRFLTHPEPLIIPFLIRTDIERNAPEIAYDVEFDLDDPGKGKQNGILLAMSEEGTKEIEKLDEEIATSALALRSCRSKRDFLQSFADSPTGFIQRYLTSQARDLSLILNKEPNGIEGTGLYEEDLRRSDTFGLPWAEEAAVIYESARLVEIQQQQQLAQQQALGGQMNDRQQSLRRG